jgi:hypothetical protein
VTTEARLAFVLFFFAVWCFLGLITWAIAAVFARGRGALPALPLALAAACAAGVAVPLLGARDAIGFFVSLATAVLASAIASVAGIALARRLAADGLSTDATRPEVSRGQPTQSEPDAESD